MIICLCMGLSDEDMQREISGGCSSFDELVQSKLADPTKACRECERDIELRIENKRGRK